jgi:hypothetical protein
LDKAVVGPLPELRLQNLPEWQAGESDIRAVLKSTSLELWKYFPGTKLPPIEIWARGGPISLYKRGPNGEIRVKLATGKTYWAQYAFQWGHEFCHVLCGLKEQTNPNHWFEESLCEMSSLFCLRAMAISWETHPPYSNWKSYSKALKSYAEERLTHGVVPDKKSFVEWFAENEDDMRKNSVDRERNSKVACMLLPLFEAEPEHWEAIADLNTERFNKFFTFQQYLEAWRRNTAEKHRPFIDKIAAAFKLKLNY